jgi:hypothetical protein
MKPRRAGYWTRCTASGECRKARRRQFFYYAGHGSRIANTLAKNSSGMDSTLVPADTLLGAPDIRSKELDRIYLQARKRNVEFTAVEDSCFSGAGTRGPRPQ